MRITSAAFDREVAGTTSGDGLEVNAWRGGTLVLPHLDLADWSLSWDADRQVQGQASVMVTDPDGTLTPWSMTDPLAPGGTLLQMSWVSGLSGTRVPLGWWRIRKVRPTETWRLLRVPTDTTAPGPVTATNLVPGPSFETPGTTNATTVRTNLVTSPRGTTTTQWVYSASDEVGTTTLVTGAGDGPVLPNGSVLPTYVRRTVTTAKTTGSTGFQIGGTTAIPTTIAAGDIYAASVWIRSSVDTTINGFRITARNGSTSVGLTETSSVALTRNVWRLLSVAIASAATIAGPGDNIQLWAYQTSGTVLPAGAVMEVTGAIVEKAPAVRPYFDGVSHPSAVPDPDLNVAWSGTANASVSLLRGTPPVGALVANTAAMIRSSQWAAGGAASLRLIPTPQSTGASLNQTFAVLGSTAAGAMLGTVAGKTYRVQGRLRLTAAHTGSSFNGNARKIGLQYNNAAGTSGAVVVASAAAPNAAGEYDLAVTVTLPVDTVWVRVVLYHGAPVGTGDVWWDHVMLVDNTYTGPYFDGSTRGKGVTYAWTGTAHNSTSTAAPLIVTHGQTLRRVSGGGTVAVDADELTASIVLNRLDAEVAVPGPVLTEVTRLLRDICPVRVLPGVVDADVPASLVYSDSRMDAVDDLLAVVQATHRMAGDGALEVLPTAGVGPVWTVAGGPDGVMLALERALSDDGVYNAVTSTGETPEGQPLVGRAFTTDGPLRWGGPFGRVPLFHKAVATTPDGVTADATTLLANRQTSGEVDLAVTCLAHPGLQPHDRVTLLAPTRVGDSPITGRVVAVSLRSTGTSGGVTPAKSMGLTVRVATTDLEAIAAKVRP